MRFWVVLAVLFASASMAGNAKLEAVREQVSALKYPQAARTLDELRQTDGLSRTEALEFFTLEGLVKGALDDGDAAKAAFTRALLIDPELKLPGKVAPRVSTPFLEAKSWVKEHGGLELSTSALSRLSDGSWNLDVSSLKDPLSLVTDVRFDLDEDGARRTLVIPVSQAKQLTGRGSVVVVRWALLTARRWVLAEGGPLSLEKPVAVAPRPQPAPVSVTTAPRAPFSKAPGIAALAIGAGVGLVGALLLNGAAASATQARGAMTFEELRSATRAGRTSQTYGGLLLTAGLVSAAVGAALLIVGFTSEPAPTTLSFSATVDGGFAVLSGALP